MRRKADFSFQFLHGKWGGICERLLLFIFFSASALFRQKDFHLRGCVFLKMMKARFTAVFFFLSSFDLAFTPLSICEVEAFCYLPSNYDKVACSVFS